MRIEIDGRSIQKPEYAAELDDKKYVWYLRNAHQLWERGQIMWSGVEVRDPNQAILQELARDPQYPQYMQNIVANGNRELYPSDFVRYIAKDLARHNQALELIAGSGVIRALPMPSENENPIPATTELVKARSSDFRDAVPELGLEEGMVICRGNVDKVKSMSGGILFVDGSVNELSSNRAGIIYINGDLYHLGSTEREVIIVAGRIHEYVQTGHHPAGGFYTEKLPSPFVFASDRLEGKRVGEKIEHPVDAGAYAMTNTARPFEGAFQVPQERLANWTPQETAERALELCKDRASSDLDKVKQMMGQIGDTKTMADFYNKHIIGYFTGKIEEFWDGMRRATP